MKLKNLAINVGLTGLSVAVIAVAAEQVLRALDYEPRPLRIKIGRQGEDWRLFHAFEDRYFESDADLFWRPRMGFEVFNPQGYLGPELTPTKTEGEFRIFAVGDSNTLGWLEDATSWPRFLDQLLQDREREVAVTNAGVYGYSSYQGLIRFRQSLTYDPDLVLISFGSNDAHPVPVSDREFGRAELNRCSWAQKLKGYRLGLVLASACRNLGGRGSGELRPRVSLQEYRSNLAEIVQLAQERGISVALLTRPYIGGLGSSLRWKTFAPQYNAVTAEVASEYDVPLVDLYSHFKGRADLFADESHFNSRGHELAAQIVLESLEPLLPAPLRGRDAA